MNVITYKIKFRFGVYAFQEPPLCNSTLFEDGALLFQSIQFTVSQTRF
jgi:hypothetical protein